jgi:hypothetical protein
MKTKVNMSKAALLIELGWEPINDFLNRQRASYFSYINNLPDNTIKIAVFSKNTGHEINFVIHIIFDIRLDMIV